MSATNEAFQVGVQSTPTFFLGKTSDMKTLSVPYPGQTQIVGAQLYDTFKAAIDKVLSNVQ